MTNNKKKVKKINFFRTQKKLKNWEKLFFFFKNSPIFLEKVTTLMIIKIIIYLIFFLLISRLLISIIPHFFSKQNLNQKYQNNYAIITGGTDGIGLTISKELTKQGFIVYIIGKETNKLSLNDFNLGSKIHFCDLENHKNIEEICNWIELNHPSLLINASGLCIPSLFKEINNPSEYISAHISSLVEITQCFIKNHSKKSGIVFFSSQVSFWSNPFASLYASTKSFTDQFARSISIENPDIDIL